MPPARARVARKSVHIPVEGEFLTDGVRLVEVLRKTRAGFCVLDVTRTLDDGNIDEVLTIEEATTNWRLVEPEQDHGVA